jgi:Zn ribbon nucleic-acid-binding protein
MRKPVPCPSCADELLATIWEKEQTRIKCRECGWSHTFAPPPHSDALDAEIARVVRAFQREH